MNVLQIIFISFPNEKLRAYFISSCILSSAERAPWSPLFSTCHRPVSPEGAMKRSMYSSVVSNSASYKGRGRLPTMDISPFRILTSCGSSSILYLRMIRPTLVIRGSFSNLTKVFFCRDEIIGHEKSFVGLIGGWGSFGMSLLFLCFFPVLIQGLEFL